jgi:hypothetical protein
MKNNKRFSALAAFLFFALITPKAEPISNGWIATIGGTGLAISLATSFFSYDAKKCIEDELKKPDLSLEYRMALQQSLKIRKALMYAGIFSSAAFSGLTLAGLINMCGEDSEKPKLPDTEKPDDKKDDPKADEEFSKKLTGYLSATHPELQITKNGNIIKVTYFGEEATITPATITRFSRSFIKDLNKQKVEKGLVSIKNKISNYKSLPEKVRMAGTNTVDGKPLTDDEKLLITAIYIQMGLNIKRRLRTATNTNNVIVDLDDAYFAVHYKTGLDARQIEIFNPKGTSITKFVDTAIEKGVSYFKNKQYLMHTLS